MTSVNSRQTVLEILLKIQTCLNIFDIVSLCYRAIYIHCLQTLQHSLAGKYCWKGSKAEDFRFGNNYRWKVFFIENIFPACFMQNDSFKPYLLIDLDVNLALLSATANNQREVMEIHHYDSLPPKVRQD